MVIVVVVGIVVEVAVTVGSTGSGEGLLVMVTTMGAGTTQCDTSGGGQVSRSGMLSCSQEWKYETLA